MPGRKSSTQERRPSVEEDEMLARMLQFEEQSQSSSAAGHRKAMSEQELLDLEVAKQFARMDMQSQQEERRRRSQQGDVMPYAQLPPQQMSSRRRSSSFSAHQGSSAEDLFSQQHMPGSSLDPRFSTASQDPRQEISSGRRSSTASASSHRRAASAASLQDRLEYARRLQEQAFSDLQRKPKSNANQRITEQSDLELARKMQELENKGMGRLNSVRRGMDASDYSLNFDGSAEEERGEFRSGSFIGRLAPASSTPETALERWGSNSIAGHELGDERLARYMEVTGESLRNLSQAQLGELLQTEGVDRSAGMTRSSPDSNRQSVSSRGASNQSPNYGRSSSSPNDIYWNQDETNQQSSSFGRLAAQQNQMHYSRTRSLSPSGGVRPSQIEAGPAQAYKSPQRMSAQTVERPTTGPSPRRMRPFMSEDDRRSLSPPIATSSPNSPVPSHHPYVRAGAKSAPTTPVRGTLATVGRRDFPSVEPMEPMPVPGENASSFSKEKKKKKRSFLGFGSRSNPRSEAEENPPSMLPTAVSIPAAIPPFPTSGVGIPGAIPPPPGGSVSAPIAFPSTPALPARPGPLPHSISVQRDIAQNMSNIVQSMPRGTSICSVCGRSGGSFIAALDKKYHTSCFRCVTCNEVIDASRPFSFSRDRNGDKHPHHRKCFAELFGVQCAVCKQAIPANHDGTVSFVKHPFFDSEQMCPHHAVSEGRRCTGCHRFEPEGDLFADLNDAGRCVCYACCRSVIVDNSEVKPLWAKVISFFEHKLMLPIWDGMREIPILVVGYDALNDQMTVGNNPHNGSSQIMARGLCLTEHDHGRRSFRLPSLRFNQTSSSFDPVDREMNGFTYYEVPTDNRGNSNADVFAILCLSGLPRDLTASILAHEATHAWIKLHPKYEIRKPLPAQVEEGCAQLIAMLFLTEGLEPPEPSPPDSPGPSDEKLRQYFRFSIETDDNEIYGAGYRRAAVAYRDIGIEALMHHVVRYRDFPRT